MDNVNQPAAGGSKTGMWVALIIAIIVLGVGSYFLFARENGGNTNNANAGATNSINSQVIANTNKSIEIDITGWSTYQNTAYGYELQYPQWWALADSMNSGAIDSNANSISFAEVNPYSLNKFSVNVQNPTDCTTALECANKRLPSTDEVYVDDSGLMTMTVGKIEGVGITRKTTESGNWRYRYFFALKDDKLFTLQSIASPDTTGTNDAISDAIFESFTITN